MKLAFLYELLAKLYYGFDISPFENANDFSRHDEIDERYNSNNASESEKIK